MKEESDDAGWDDLDLENIKLPGQESPEPEPEEEDAEEPEEDKEEVEEVHVSTSCPNAIHSVSSLKVVLFFEGLALTSQLNSGPKPSASFLDFDTSWSHDSRSYVLIYFVCLAIAIKNPNADVRVGMARERLGESPQKGSSKV